MFYKKMFFYSGFLGCLLIYLNTSTQYREFTEFMFMVVGIYTMYEISMCGLKQLTTSLWENINDE